jgi:carboxylesterase
MSDAAARAFFDAWNRRAMDEAMEHVADDCVYNDFSFVRPHVGKASVRHLFEQVAVVAPDVTFDMIHTTGGRDIGAYWEILARGQRTGRFGVSMYRFDDDDRLVWALDAADPGPSHRTNDFHTLREARPLSHDGSRLGALVVHGFTGNPSSMRPIAEAFVGQGWSVEMPLLPGHGTLVDEMIPTRWEDWSGAVEEAYQKLVRRCDKVVVVGLSMGGTLTLWLATQHPELAGIALVNPMAKTDGGGMREAIQGMVDGGVDRFDGIGSDIAKQGVAESAYASTPTAPLVSLLDACAALEGTWSQIECPVLLMTSPQDHVVPPVSSDWVAETVSGPVERVSLDRSYHVATLDHDGPAIIEHTLAFAAKVTAPVTT